MKVSFFSVCLLFLSAKVTAQSVGIAGGGWPGQLQVRGTVPVTVELNNHWTLRSELAYARRYNKDLLLKLPNDEEYYELIISYAELATLFQYKLEFMPFGFYLQMGPSLQYGLQMGASYREQFTYYEEKIEFQSIQAQRWDAGIQLGAGMQKEIRAGKQLFLEIRYYLGLLDLDASAQTAYNEGLMIQLGLLIPLREKTEHNPSRAF